MVRALIARVWPLLLVFDGFFDFFHRFVVFTTGWKTFGFALVFLSFSVTETCPGGIEFTARSWTTFVDAARTRQDKA